MAHQLFAKHHGIEYSRISPASSISQFPIAQLPIPDRHFEKVVLYVGDEHKEKLFYCKKKLLMDNSHVLKATLESMNAAPDPEYGNLIVVPGMTIRIRDVRPKVFEEIIEFMKYKLERAKGMPFILLPWTNIPMEILIAAQKLEMPKVIKLCSMIILQRRPFFLELGLGISLYMRIKDLPYPELVEERKSTEDKLLRWFDYIARTEQFSILSPESLKFLMEHEHFWVASEAKLFYCCVKWAEGKCRRQKLHPTKENLKEILNDVIQKIRFPLMTPSEFETIVVPSGILDSNQCQQIKDYFNLLKTDRDAANNFYLPFEKTRRLGQQFLADIFPTRSSARERELISGEWQILRFDTNRPIEIDTIILSGRVERDDTDDIRIILKWKKLGSSKASAVQYVTGIVRTEGLISIRLPTPLRTSVGSRYRLKLKFLRNTIWTRASMWQYVFGQVKKVSVDCKQRGFVGIEVNTFPMSCSFRGIKFRLMSKRI